MLTATRCGSFYNDDLNMSNDTSTGRGYCETTIPRTNNTFGFVVYSVNTLTRVWTRRPCSFAVAVDKEFTKFDHFD